MKQANWLKGSYEKKFVPLCVFLITLFGMSSIVTAAETVRFQRMITDSLKTPMDMAVMDDGNMYILDQQQAKIFVFDHQGLPLLTIGEYGTGPGKLKAPSALTISSYGEIVVADTGNSRVSVFSTEGSFLYQLGNSGSLPGQFSKPSNVAVDAFGYIYVVDADLKKLSKFSPKGVFFSQQDFDYKPDDIAFDLENNMYVLSKEEGLIVKYNMEAETAVKIEYMEDAYNFMSDAVSFDVDDRGDIYLIEHEHHSIVKIDQEGNKLLSFGSKGEARGQFMKPGAIVAGNQDMIYVADAKNSRVQVLSIMGSSKPMLVTSQNKPPMVDFEQSISSEKSIVDLKIHRTYGLFALSESKGHILQNMNMQSQILGDTKDFSEKLRDPKSLFVADNGNIFVADTGNNRLKFLNSDGTHDYSFGEKGSNNGQFYGLSGVAINDEGFIYVADTQNNRIQVFNGDGIYLNSIGEKSAANVTENRTAPVIFHHPTTLAFDSIGQLFVLDSRNARIVVLTKEGAFVKEIGGATGIASLNQPVDFSLDENDYLYIADRADHSIKIIDPQGQYVMDFGSRGMGPSYFPKLSAVAAEDGKIYVADYLVSDIKVFNFDLNRMSNDPKMVMLNKVNEMPDSVEEIVQEQEEVVEEIVQMEVPLEEMEETMIEEVAQEHLMVDSELSLEEAKKMVGHDTMRYKISKDGTKLFATIISYPLEGIMAAEDVQFSAARKVAMDVINQELAKKIGVALDAVLEYISIESEEKMGNGGLKLTVSVPKEILFKKYKEAKLQREMSQKMLDKI